MFIGLGVCVVVVIVGAAVAAAVAVSSVAAVPPVVVSLSLVVIPVVVGLMSVVAGFSVLSVPEGGDGSYDIPCTVGVEGGESHLCMSGSLDGVVVGVLVG